MKFYRDFCLAFAFTLVTAIAAAHGNDDHEHSAPVANAAAVAPRASAQTEEFELVAVLQGRHLVIYLDRFDTNAAVRGAQLEVESQGKWKLFAKEGETGVYVLDLPKGEMEGIGKYPLIFSLQTKDSSDVMTASIEIPDEDEAHDHGENGVMWWKWLIGVTSGLGLVLAALIILRARNARVKEGQTSFEVSPSASAIGKDFSGGAK